jgi:adenylate kinase
LFDGFPRTASQAEGLTALLADRGESLIAVVEIAVPMADLMERLSGRRVCPTCGATYHIKFNPPKVDELCDRDGTKLIQRADDTPDAIERRLALYFEMTEPLLAYYREMGLLETVNGLQSIEDVQDDIDAVIRSRTADVA